MNKLQIIKGVECYLDENGVAQLNLENVARGLGIIKIDKKDGKEYVRIHKPNLQKWLNAFGLIKSEKDDLPQFIPEPIFYLLAMKADNQTAREFQKMVAYDILPSIRKHGMYAIDELLENPDIAIQAFTALKEERARNKELTIHNAQLEQKVSEYEPKAQYVDTILSSPGAVTITQIAADYSLSARALNKILHEERIQHNVGGQWILYKEHMGLGYTKSETIQFERSDGKPDSKMQTKWTQKGRLLIHNLLERRGIQANMDKPVANRAS